MGCESMSSTILAATPRMTEAMVRSRVRTPASRVYWSMMASMVGFREFDLFGGDAVLFELAWEEVFAGDGEFVVLGIAGDFDEFHAVFEGGRDGLHIVCGADEDDFGEVEGDGEVVVGEGVVLLGVEDFEECGGGVAPEIGTEFVDFVEHHDGVVGAGLAEFLDDATGEGADVGTAMAADVGFVAYAAEGDADEGTAEGFGDGFSE